MGEKKKFDNRIIIGIVVAVAIVGVVVYAVFGGKGYRPRGAARGDPACRWLNQKRCAERAIARSALVFSHGTCYNAIL